MYVGFIVQLVGSGDKVRFWEDAWAGSRSLRNIFPMLFSLSVKTVRKYGFKLEGGEWFKEGFRKLLSLE